MGGSRAEVGPETRSIVLESASFEPTGVRRTSVRLGLRTESSSRFEKSLDPEHAWLAAEKFAALLGALVPGAAPAGPAMDVGGWRYEGRVVTLRKDRLAAKLGLSLPADRVAAILRSLQFGVEESGTAFSVSVPSFRATKDIAIEDDLIEEVGRMHRYDNVPERAPSQPMVMPWRDPELALLRRVRGICAAGLGFHEAYNYSFLHDGIIAALGLEPGSFSRVQNPVDVRWSRIRRDVAPSLLGNLEVNLRREDEVRLFEAGKGYRPEVRDQHGLPSEVHQLAFVLAHKRGSGDPLADLRGALELLLRRVGRAPAFAALAPDGQDGEPRPVWLHPGRSLAVHAGADRPAVVGHAGELHPEAASRLGVKAACAIATLDLRRLLAVPEEIPRYRPQPRFPVQPVDVALFVPTASRVGDVAGFLRSLDPLVAAVRLFEVYRGKGVPPGHKSVNFTVTLASDERTLTTDDQDRYLARLRKSAPDIGGELRTVSGPDP
jgi:phenylalanyl-tRNA synthetase beta chain